MRVASAYGRSTAFSSWNDFCGRRTLQAQFWAYPQCFLLYSTLLTGPVAQLVEQRIENPRVTGSIPVQATNFNRRITFVLRRFSFQVA